MLSETNGTMLTSDNQKSEKPVEKRLAAVAKENGEPMGHICFWSDDWWFSLLWCFGVASVQLAT